MAQVIQIPDFEFSGFYYPEILEDLIQFMRVNVPEITDESSEEPFVQLIRAFSLVGHLSNVLLDLVARERFLPTARLRESVRAQLALIDYPIAQAKPAQADLVVQLSEVLTSAATTVPPGSRFATTDSPNTPAITYEALAGASTQQTDQVGFLLSFDADAAGGSGFTDHTSAAAMPGTSFSPGWGSAPAAGDALYIGHPEMIWDTISWDIAKGAAPIAAAVWEYFDGDFEDGEPDLVVNNGPNLTLSLNRILGPADRTGTVIRVRCIATGGLQDLVVSYATGINRVTTNDFLGQTAPSTNTQDYIVGRDWKELVGVSDETSFLKIVGTDEKVTYPLPQSVTQDWRPTVVNGLAAYWIRLRIISTTGAGSVPAITRVRIDEGNQYQVLQITQGESQQDAPLGSSTGLPDQKFTLNQFPVLDDASLQVFVFEATEEPWIRVQDFLASNSTDKHFTVQFLDDGHAEVTFGNGVNGKVPAVGTDSIRATYRTMEPLDGNVGQNTITVNQSGVAFINAVTNPRAASGHRVADGSTPEDLARLKIAGPASLRTKDRAVNVPDVEALATAFMTPDGSKPVLRALGREEAFGPKTAEVVVVGPGGALLTANELRQLETFFNGDSTATPKVPGRVLLNHQVTATNYVPRAVNVTATVYGGNRTAILTALAALLSPVALQADGTTFVWSFGGEAPISRINAEIFNTIPRPRKVVITSPSSDVGLATRELPAAGTLAITVNP